MSIKVNDKKIAGGPIRVLMRMRPNVLSQRGGDTVVMERLKDGLIRRGLSVTLDLEGSAPTADFDIVHLFNFANPEHTKALAEQAHHAGRPFVVTTLYEDTPAYRNQGLRLANALLNYADQGQDRSWWSENKFDVTKVVPSERFHNDWTAAHASALFSNGASETAVLQRDYPGCRVIEVPLGFDRTGAVHSNSEPASPDMFFKEYGIKDFVLCVGRLEWRKNQLMLLKALENSDLPVVLAASGFTYDPEYAKAVRAFKRKGKTLVVDRLDPEMLSSAYGAARVHCLPSWYELPGLVSLEAGFHGCNVVVTLNGTSVDYFEDQAFYCEPWNESSIFNAVLAAYYGPVNKDLTRWVSQFTWERTVEDTTRAYEAITGKFAEATATGSHSNGTTFPSTAQPEVEPSEFAAILEAGEVAAKQREYVQAHELLAKALALNPRSIRALRAQGAVYIAEGDSASAKRFFEQAFDVDPSDAKTLSGLGMCLMNESKLEQAYSLFVEALSYDPEQLVAILQLSECAYRLDKFEDLDRILVKYLEAHPDDLDMQYCHAAAMFKMGQLDKPLVIADRILASRPGHMGSVQLKEAIAEARTKAPKGLLGAIEVSKTSPPAAQAGAHDGNFFAKFDSVDARITELEEWKRKKRLPEVRTGISDLRQQAGISGEQQEKLNVLEAECNILEGSLEQADRLYNAVLNRNPLCARALCGKGALAANGNDVDAARSFFERALKVQPEYDTALAGLGLCAYWVRDFEKAWEFYEHAVRNNCENARALLGMIELGYPLQRLDRVAQAIKAYLEIHPADVEFLYALAGCNFSQGKYSEAADGVSMILIFNPQHAHALELHSMIVEKTQQGQTSAGAR